MVKFIFFISCLFISVNLFAQNTPLADPTKPLNFKVKKARKIYQTTLPTLQSIIIKSGKREAILNNKVYQKGQWVNGYRVTQIDAKKVLLEYQNKMYKLTLYSSYERYSK